MSPMSSSTASDLTHYRHASLYEKTFADRRADVEYFCSLIGDAHPVDILEYGAGAGRVTIPLAKNGAEVTAVDASGAMIELLHKRLREQPVSVQGRVSTRLGDMTKLKLNKRFDWVLATFNVVAHLEDFRQMGRFLRRAKAHLKQGGTLAFDVPIPHPDELESDPDDLHRCARFKHPDSGDWITQTERFEYDPLRQTLLVESTYASPGSRDELVVPLTLRQWFPKEIEAIAGYEGFECIETHADYSQNPGLCAEDSLVFLLREQLETAPARRSR